MSLVMNVINVKIMIAVQKDREITHNLIVNNRCKVLPIFTIFTILAKVECKTQWGNLHGAFIKHF